MEPCLGMVGFRHRAQPAGSWSDGHDKKILPLSRCRCKDCQGREYQNWYGKALMQVCTELAPESACGSEIHEPGKDESM